MISIDFPINIARKEGLFSTLSSLLTATNNFDLYTSVFSNEEDREILDFILSNAKHGKYSISVHAVPVDGKYTTFKSEEEAKDSAVAHISMLRHVRAVLDDHGLFGRTTVVYHPGDIVTTLADAIHFNAVFFEILCKWANNASFDILAETLSINHPKCESIGCDYKNLEKLIDEVNCDNFGICWDIGHTRLNAIEEHSNLLPSKKILDKVKFTHIHGYDMVVGDSDSRSNVVGDSDSRSNVVGDSDSRSNVVGDHTDFSNSTFTLKEIAALHQNGYKGHYSLEYDFSKINKPIATIVEDVKVFSTAIETIQRNLDTTNRLSERVLPVDLTCHVEHERGNYAVGLVNISEDGCCLSAYSDIKETNAFIIFKTGGVTLRLKAELVWCKNDTFGFKFTSLSDLEISVIKHIIYKYN